MTIFLTKPKRLFLYISLFVPFSLTGQIDTTFDSSSRNRNKTVNLTVPSRKLDKPTSLTIKSDLGFKNAYASKNKENARKNKEEEIENKGILSAAKLSEERFLKSWKKLNAPYPVIDQDLGSFRTASKAVRIICRDFQYPDGDRVTISINDIPVIKNVTLKASYQSFELPLQAGINKIVFTALNQGSSGPNTAGFKVFDDAGNLISSNEWNLATGAKATVIIAKHM